jgi:hypothetical protein
MKASEIIVESRKPINEGIRQAAQEIVDALNQKFTEMVGPSPMSKEVGRDLGWSPFEVMSGSSSRWTRGDSAQYKDPNYITVPNREYKHLAQSMSKKQLAMLKKMGEQQGMVDMAWNYIQQLPGIKPMGQISAGPHGSDKMTPVFLYKNTMFYRMSDFAIAFGTTKRLKNSDIWRSSK